MQMSPLYWGILLVIVECLCQINGQEGESADFETATKKERLLTLLSMVSFNNGICQGSDGRKGVCIPSTDCTRRKGNPNGRCAQGFGICCLLEATCGDTIQTNNSYFVNPNHPNYISNSVSCAMTVQRINSNICQLRLEFETFQLASTSNGVCSADAFIITGQETNQDIPAICGINDKQHMYVDLLPGNLNPITMMVTTSAGERKKWKIRVTQIECGNPNAAPPGCLQYFIGGSGTIKSFNFDSEKPEEAGGQANYMSDSSYAICIRRESGFCGVQFRPTDNEPENFDLDPGLGIDELSSTDTSCTGDSLIIPGACNAGDNGLPWPNEPSASRFCGYRLNAIPHAPNNSPHGLISTLPGAIQIFFNSDGIPPSPRRYDRGFNLQFQQRPCTFLQSFRKLSQPEYINGIPYSRENKTAIVRNNSRFSKIMPPFSISN